MPDQIKINTALKLDPQLTNIEPFRAYEKITISNDQECAQASNQLVTVKSRINALKKEKDKVEKPLREALKAFREMAAGVLRPLETIEKILKGKIGSFMKSQQEKKDAEQRELFKKQAEERRLLAQEQQRIAMANGDAKEAESALRNKALAEKLENKEVDVHQTQRVDKGTVSHRWKYEWTLIDLKKVPLEFLTVDTKKLNEICRSYKKSPVEIDGIRFDKEIVLGVRADHDESNS